MTDQLCDQSRPTPAPPAASSPELTPATLGILIELGYGCAKDRADWGAPGTNDRHGTRYYAELISRQLGPLVNPHPDAARERDRLLQIARHAIEAVEALDARQANGVN